jgi:hypothetical protein
LGRTDTDPSTTWYQGEIGFFDFYIIPLAKKLKDCGVFGVSSDEYLNYAMQNRNEWKDRGQEIVLEMIEKVKTMEFNATETKSKSSIEGSVKKFSSKSAATNYTPLTTAPPTPPLQQPPSGYKMPRQYSM